MSFNGPEGQGRRPAPGHRPPPPPPGYGPEGFWNFIRSVTPNANVTNGLTPPPNTRPAGEGVDTQPPFPPFGFFGSGPEGFNFSPSWAMPHHPPPPHRHDPPGPHSRDDTGDDTDGHHHDHHGHHGRHSRHGRHGRGGHHSRSRSHSHHRREPEVEEDLYDISAAAGAAEHDLTGAWDRARVKEKETEKDDDMKSTSTLRDGVDTPTTTSFGEDEKEREHPDPPEEIPSASFDQHGRRGRCRGGGGGGPGRRGRCGRGFGGGRHTSWGWGGGGPNGFGFEFGRPPFAPHFGPGGGFGGPRHASGPQIDMGSAVRGLGSLGWAMSQHPLAKRLGEYISGVNASQNNSENTGGEEGVLFEGEETFSPPADVFDSSSAWTIHLALPGAKKQDVGVHWDKERGVLVVSGVVYRPGDEEFLKGLVTAERKVGLFERKIKMPPVVAENSDEEVDGDGIMAKLEDGILVITVPKRKKEKGTGEIKRVQVL
ncbi:hypothetical protein QBC36DRAFT_30400 [Triangularia setosa]|uniref:SHSP domain-containing protein n=1 Tax=Triangularia setosa TaxID=2587417 RepID=A0AAN6WER7_9PEZI|nr:hypothetical protein QBC36DRAFT_30400 [Podospora setosa]